MRTCLVMVVLLATARGSATTVMPMAIEDLTRAATQIAQVRVLESRSAWNPQHTLIYTYSRVQVVRTLKGESADTLVIKQLGGSAEGYTQTIAGIRYFQPGEDALLFLRPSAAGDQTMVIVGLMQGNFHVEHTASGQALVSNGMPLVRSGEGRPGSSAGLMTLDEITARIAGASR